MTFIAFIVLLLLAKCFLLANRHALHYPRETLAYLTWKLGVTFGRIVAAALLLFIAIRMTDWLFENTGLWLPP